MMSQNLLAGAKNPYINNPYFYVKSLGISINVCVILYKGFSATRSLDIGDGRLSLLVSSRRHSSQEKVDIKASQYKNLPSLLIAQKDYTYQWNCIKLRALE